MSEGIPKRGDRAVRRMDYAHLHATDIENETFEYHNNPDSPPIVDLSDVNLDDLGDVYAPSPSHGDSLIWDDYEQVYVNGAPGGSGADEDAIHDNLSGEINAITEATSLADSDLFLVEVASASYAKRKITKASVAAALSVDPITIYNLMIRSPVEHWEFYGSSTATIPGTTLTAFVSGTIATMITGYSNHHPGVVRLRSSASANSGYGVGRGGTGTIGYGAIFDIVFRTSASITSTANVHMGFMSLLTLVGDSDNGMWLHMVGNNIKGASNVDAAGANFTSTSYTLSANTWYRGRIALNSDNTVITFSLYNEAGTSLWSDTLSGAGYVPWDRLSVAFRAWNTGTAAVDLLHVDSMTHLVSTELIR
jgi:hypothetical protein